MKTETLYRLSGLAVIVGAVVASLTTALELVTSPYNPYGSAVWLNPPVHVAKYIGMFMLLLGLPGVYLRQRERTGVTGFIALLVVCFGMVLAGVPYTVVEFSLDPALSQQQAASVLDQTYAASPVVPILGMVGFPAVVLGIVLFAIATLRGKVLPRWTAVLGLAALGAAIVAGILGGLLPGLVPHPPFWMLLGFTGYGYALLAGKSAITAADATPPLAPELGTGGAIVGR